MSCAKSLVTYGDLSGTNNNVNGAPTQRNQVTTSKFTPEEAISAGSQKKHSRHLIAGSIAGLAMAAALTGTLAAPAFSRTLRRRPTVTR